jgi:hypothetical protein
VDLHEEIQFFLYKERVLSMPSPFDAFFNKEAIEKRKEREQPTEAEQLAAQHRSDMIAMLSDFSLAWGGHPEILEVAPGQFATGVKEVGERPPSMLTEYRAAQAHKDTISVTGNGWILSRDEYDNVMIRTTRGICAIPASEWPAFVRAVMTIPQGTSHQSGSQAASNDALPARKSQTELVAEQRGTATQNEERAQYSIKMQYATGIWGSKRGD